jgi:hypothetical protein
LEDVEIREIRDTMERGKAPDFTEDDQGTIWLLTVYFGAPSMFITLWFGFDYGTNPPLGTLII